MSEKNIGQKFKQQAKTLRALEKILVKKGKPEDRIQAAVCEVLAEVAENLASIASVYGDKEK